MPLETFNKQWNLKLCLQRGMLAGCMHGVFALHGSHGEPFLCMSAHVLYDCNIPRESVFKLRHDMSALCKLSPKEDSVYSM